MKLSEEQIRDIAVLRENLLERMDKLREELDMLQLNITALDVALKQSSFTKASEYRPAGDGAGNTPKAPGHDAKTPPADAQAKPITAKDGRTIGGMTVLPGAITITLEDDIEISQDTPPFQTFFVTRIIGEMIKNDQQEIESGTLQPDSAIKLDVSPKDGSIRTITVTDYRTEERAREIASTARWVLSRMLENA